MVELPRHPKYNTLNRKEDNTAYDKNNGSSMLGRNRLFDAFLGFELWPEMLELADTFYLEPTDLPEEQAHRLYALGLAHFALGETNKAREALDSIEGCWKQLKQERFEAAEKAEEKTKKEKGDTTQAMVTAMKGFDSRLERVEKYRNELNIWWRIAAGSTNEARELLQNASELPKGQRGRLWHALGDATNCIRIATELAKESTNQAPDLALAAHLCWQAGDANAATNAFRQLRSISSGFDLSTPIFARLAPLAEHFGLPADWRVQPRKKSDVGKRPSLESLGPFRWQPYSAPAWTLADGEQNQHSLAAYKGHPVLVVFYLGSRCQHCLEQLNLLGPAEKDFAAQGISVIAISTEGPESLQKAVEKTKREGVFRFPIVSDAALSTFKAYGVYDDFERMPLHGTFLVDGAGKVRWQDISYEPFTDMRFLLAESRRLLALSRTPMVARMKSED
jgi:peroxiredoxin